MSLNWQIIKYALIGVSKDEQKQALMTCRRTVILGLFVFIETETDVGKGVET